MFRDVRACLNSMNMTCRARTYPQPREHQALCDPESRIGLRVRCESYHQVIIEWLNTAVKLFLHAVLGDDHKLCQNRSELAGADEMKNASVKQIRPGELVHVVRGSALQ